MKKIILLALALLMVVSVFASCGGTQIATTPNKQSTPQGSTPGNNGGGDVVDVPEEQKLNVDLDSIDYGGDTVRVFHWKPRDGCVEFGMDADDINNDAVNDAIFNRNTYTEEGLGITFEWVEQDSIYYEMTAFTDKLRGMISDPTTPVDIVAAMTKGIPVLITEGLLTDLSTYSDSLDLSKAWWPSQCQDALSIKDKIYFVSGDASANLMRMMTVFFVNKTILAARGYDYEELMAKVKAYEWTIDDLIEMTTGVYEDIDNVSGISKDDKFGLCTTYFHTDAIYTGLGYKYLVKSNKEDEVFRYSTQFVTQVAIDYVTKMKNWAENNDFWIDSTKSDYETNFLNGNSFFTIHRAYYGFDLQKTDIQYAVLPAPALDVNQKRYYTTIGHQYSAFGVCTSSPDYDRAAETIQTLGYFGMHTTTPALFEVSFQGKFSKDEHTIDMFNIIRESIVFDMGRIFDYFIACECGQSGTGATKYLVANFVSFPVMNKTNFTFTSSGDPIRRLVDTYIDSANKKLLDYVEQ